MKPPSLPLAHIAITANTLEWYDFSISGFFAIVLGQLFFAGHDALSAIISSFSVFAASYLIRPLGSVAFGYLGNRRGPAVALRYATLLMAVPTVLIGLLPTYRDIGSAATILIVVLKLIQGFAAGGEYPMSAYFVAHHAPDASRGRMSSLVHVGGSLGVLLASVVTFLVGSAFEQHEIARWAWRIPFLLSIPLFIVVLKIRSAMIDDSVGQPVHREKSRPCKVSLAARSSAFIRGALLVASMEVGFYTLLVWLPNYAEIFLHDSRNDAHLSNTLALCVFTVTLLVSGWLSSTIAYKKILVACLLAVVILAYPLFAILLDFHGFAPLLVNQFIFAMLYGGIGGVLLLALYQLFKDQGKSLGMAITFTVPTALFGGTAPLVCSYVVKELHNLSFPAFYVAMFCLLALPAVMSLTDSDKDIRINEPDEPDAIKEALI